MKKNDKKEVIDLVSEYGGYLRDVADEFKNDRDVVLAAVKNYGDALEFTSDELRGDKEVVLAALETGGWVYRYCTKRMQMDLDVIAMANNGLIGGHTVDDYLCDELINLKEKYGVDKLEVVLEILSAKVEINNLCANLDKSSISGVTVRM